MTIPTRFLNELRDRLLLSDVIAAKINLTKAGREFKGCCPFHNEKTPSFYVNNEKQFYHCFGCGAHGDAINFMMAHDNVSFIEAIEILASQAGMEVPKQSPEEIQKFNQQKDLFALMDTAAAFFESNLHKNTNADALNYLNNRGISDQTLKQFRVGFSPANDQELRKYLLEQGFTDDQMMATGLIRPSNKAGKEPYAFFRDRVMFPVLDSKGRVVAFGGRILPEHLRPPIRSDFKPPKYINSSDTELYHKGHIIYGETHAKQALNDGLPAVVVEGYLDVIACFKEGFRGAVAPLGTSITEEQIFRIWNMYNDSERCPVFCFDGDNAGRRAASRVIDRVLPLLKPNHSVSFVFLPEGEDPDSILRTRGKKAFESILQNTIPLYEFIWITHTSNTEFDTPEKRAGLSQALDKEVEKISDRTTQNFYRQSFKEKLKQKFGNVRTYNIKAPANTNNYKLGRPAFSQEHLSYLILLATILQHPEIFPEVEEDLGRLDIKDPNLNRLREKILYLLGENSSLDIDDLNSHLIKAGFESELSMVLSRSVRTHAGFIKRENSQEIVLEGWKEITSILNSKNMRKELLDASRELAENFCKEKEDKVLALHDVHNATDN